MHYKQSFTYGRHPVTLECGEIARQADGAVLVNMNDTAVLATVVANRSPNPNVDFLPLTVDYQEKNYAAGRIPGGFFKREGRPSEKEILTARLTDRSIRPLFPAFFYHETQIILTVLSFNPEVDSDIPAMLGASAALAVSGIPFNGPIASARMGMHGGELSVNPTISELEKSDLNLVVAGTRGGVLMVESEAKELSEEQMLSAVMGGHEAMQVALDAIGQLAENAAKPKWDWQSPSLDEAAQNKIAEFSGAFADAYRIPEKQERNARLTEIRQEIKAATIVDDSPPQTANLVKGAMKKAEARVVRERILAGELRIDGRGTKDVRPITIRVGALPRVHGSALFTRGETQALVAATLGTARDEQRIDSLAGEYHDRFMMHYNFPPFATGEVGRGGIPKRREIGHGRLAKRGLLAVMPDLEKFGYSLRLVSEITESNGSSSMASVCGGSLALMDAGVPIARPVAGIAMGLIKGDDKFAVLSDILGDEDHLGDMDFKVAGTESGVTALQMDIKIDEIGEQIMHAALAQASEGRRHILECMNEVLSAPRDSVSRYAPRILKIKISVDKIRDVIGKGGSVIRTLTETTGTVIDVEDDGTITVSGPNLEVCEKAQRKIEAITAELEVGRVYEGRIINILENVGAVVSILPGRDGLLHISQIANERVNKVSDYLEQNQIVRVKVIQADEKGRVRFSMKNIDPAEEATAV